jgi:hypothetical protein
MLDKIEANKILIEKKGKKITNSSGSQKHQQNSEIRKLWI